MTVTKKNTADLTLPERTSLALSQLRSKPNADGAHFFRTSYRRLQTWLQSVDGVTLDKDQKRTIKYLDKILRACGKLRDTELHIKMLEEIQLDDDQARTSIERLLQKRRDKRKDKLTDLLQEGKKLEDAWPLLKRLNYLAKSNHREAESTESHLQQALSDYTQYVASRSATTAENLHQYRLACKNFRYRAELAGEPAQPVLKLFKTVQNAIGEWHDWQLLLELNKKKLAKHPSKLLTKIEEITAAKLADAFRTVETVEPELLKITSGESQRKPVSSAQTDRRRNSQRQQTA